MAYLFFTPSCLSDLNDISKTDLNFILSNFNYLKIIKLNLPEYVECEQIKLRAKETLLGLQERDKEEKTIMLGTCSQGWKIFTLPYPP
jgi:hypothetical protein